MSQPTQNATAGLGQPWRQDPEEARVIRDSSGRMVGAMDTGEMARLVVDSANAGDVDARREVTRLMGTLGHYRHRSQMSPSERQGYLGETVDESIQPERYYGETRERPSRSLLSALYGALVEYEMRGPSAGTGERLAGEIRAAMTRFEAEAKHWLR